MWRKGVGREHASIEDCVDATIKRLKGYTKKSNKILRIVTVISTEKRQ